MLAPSPIESRLRAAEERLEATFVLRRRQLPAHHADAVGIWKDEPVRLSTRIYEGDAVACLRAAIVTGTQLTLGSLLVIPRANRPAPILGAELSWSGTRGETTLYADLIPVRDAMERDEELARIGRTVPRDGALPAIAQRPAWRGAWDSPSALGTRVQRVQEATALAAFDRYVSAFSGLLAATTPSADRAPHVRTIQTAYLAARRTDESLAILKTIFGSAWAEDYVGRVLFPVL